MCFTVSHCFLFYPFIDIERNGADVSQPQIYGCSNTGAPVPFMNTFATAVYGTLSGGNRGYAKSISFALSQNKC